MTDESSFPDYRVRLFLSADLVGSTGYKNSEKAKESVPPEWVKVFQNFYEHFPARLKDNYKRLAKDGNRNLADQEISDGHPRLWKTIGDEILFCCRIHSLCHLGACLDAFIESLHQYAKSELESRNLNIKGNAWVASFPVPNVALPIASGVNGSFPLSEETEEKVDKDPRSFDFLGTCIDAGFRIAKNASSDELTISPTLAFLLCQTQSLKDMTGYERAIRFKEMQGFKGVAKGESYPVLVINTCRQDDKRELRGLERQLLGIPQEADNERLKDYLEKYLVHIGIEIPEVKQSLQPVDTPSPQYYSKFKEEWLRQKDDDEGIEDSGNQQNEQDERLDEQQEKKEYQSAKEEIDKINLS